MKCRVLRYYRTRATEGVPLPPLRYVRPLPLRMYSYYEGTPPVVRNRYTSLHAICLFIKPPWQASCTQYIAAA